MKKTVLALLVDVTPLTRTIISRAFKPADFDVMWAGDVSEAMELSKQCHVDLLLLDLNRPLHAAWEMFERLTALNRETPVILLTEHKSAYERAVAAQVGAVLQKPFNVAALVHVANVLLAKPSSGKR